MHVLVMLMVEISLVSQITTSSLSFPQYVIRVGSQLAKDYANYLLLQNFTSPLFIKNPLPQHFSLNATQIAIAQTKRGRLGARVFHVFRSISKDIIALPFLHVIG